MDHLLLHNQSGLFFSLWIINNFPVETELSVMFNGCCFKPAVEQWQDLIITSSYEQIAKENRGQEEELDASIHLYLNGTHHSGNESWIPKKLFLHFWVSLIIYVFLEKAIHCTNCQVWIGDKPMYYFMPERGFCEDFEGWFFKFLHLERKGEKKKN